MQDSHEETILAELEPLQTSTAYLTRMPNHAVVTPALSHCSHKKRHFFYQRRLSNTKVKQASSHCC
jgi:hypothetical protein